MMLSASIARKVMHISISLTVVVASYFVSSEVIISACIAFGCAMLGLRFLSVSFAVHHVGRRTYGEVFFPLGIALTAYFYLPLQIEAFQFGVLILGVSDALASLVGEKYGKHRVSFFPGKKTAEGTFAFFLSALALTVLFSPSTQIMWVLLIPLLLTVVEGMLILGLDNLFLPIIAAFLISIIF